MNRVQLIVNIDVDDLGRAIAFYEAALGLRLARRLFDGAVAEMTGASSTIHLLAAPAGTAAFAAGAVARDYRRHWTPVHFDVVVEDLAAAAARAVAAGATLEGAVRAFAWGKLATLADPFGHGFCFVELTAAGYGAVAAGAAADRTDQEASA